MYKLFILLISLSACVDRPRSDCQPIKIEGDKKSPYKSFEDYRVLIFSFKDPKLLNQIKVQTNALKLKDTIDIIESELYRYKYLELKKNDALIIEATILLNKSCFSLKLDSTNRNYIIHMESKYSLRCFANNKEFIEIDG